LKIYLQNKLSGKETIVDAEFRKIFFEALPPFEEL